MSNELFLIITDSLGAPRWYPEKIKYTESYPFKLKNYLDNNNIPNFIFSDNGLDSIKLTSYTKNKLTLYEPKNVLMQFGIVDCAPRCFSRKEIYIFNKLRVGKYVKKIASKYHSKLSSYRNITYVSIEDFEKNMKFLYNKFHENGANIISINIFDACDVYIDKSPNIQNKINAYNEIIKRFCDKYIYIVR